MSWIPGEPQLLLGQVRGQPVDRLAGARRMSIRARMLVGALVVGALLGAALLNRPRVHTDRLRAPSAPQGAGTVHGDRSPGGSPYRCAGE